VIGTEFHARHLPSKAPNNFFSLWPKDHHNDY
jgi:hypothetical protein